MGISYKDSGVDIQKGDEFVDIIKSMSPKNSKIGLFGAVFDLKAQGFKDPLLVSGTDGVGTKLKIAELMDKHDTIGIDLVAMCVNDILCHGAKPLFFLDYYATGKLDLNKSKEIISGIINGCNQSGCELVGGETAEMPFVYKENDYDLAGFAVGAVERDSLLPYTNKVTSGDILYGIPSSGLHSNGFSLVNKLISLGKIDLNHQLNGKKVGHLLLEPTKIYVKEILQLLSSVSSIKALAHITGGGLYDNITRVIPDNLDIEIDYNSWKRAEIFDFVQKSGDISEQEMRQVYNLGIGFVIVSPEDQNLQHLPKIGRVCKK